jgi:hypothetical protein
MGKEKEFNDILDECLDRLMFKGDTVEQCLADYPQYADELKPLLEASLVTSRISSLEPDQEFKAKARNELFEVLRKAEEKRSRSMFRFGWQPRWAGIVAVIAVRNRYSLPSPLPILGKQKPMPGWQTEESKRLSIWRTRTT